MATSLYLFFFFTFKYCYNPIYSPNYK